jgi:hypothetical protein
MPFAMNNLLLPGISPFNLGGGGGGWPPFFSPFSNYYQPTNAVGHSMFTTPPPPSLSSSNHIYSPPAPRAPPPEQQLNQADNSLNQADNSRMMFSHSLLLPSVASSSSRVHFHKQRFTPEQAAGVVVPSSSTLLSLENNITEQLQRQLLHRCAGDVPIQQQLLHQPSLQPSSWHRYTTAEYNSGRNSKCDDTTMKQLDSTTTTTSSRLPSDDDASVHSLKATTTANRVLSVELPATTTNDI